MNSNKQLGERFAAIAGATLLAATSAFAETRPSNETAARAEEQRSIRRERAAEQRRGDNSRNRIERRERADERRAAASRDDRSARRDDRSYRDNRAQRDDRTYRDNRARRDDRTYRDNRARRDDRTYRGNRSRRDERTYRDNRRAPSPSVRHNRQPFYAKGRITDVRRHGAGYRVWVHGARYPFFVPAAHYHRDRFRVGVIVNLGGYYNRGGYYDYYDGRSRGALRGFVETVDYRRDTFIVRNEATGSFVTVVDRDRRSHVRPGDFVEVYGDWSRHGVLRAYDVDLLDTRYYGR